MNDEITKESVRALLDEYNALAPNYPTFWTGPKIFYNAPKTAQAYVKQCEVIAELQERVKLLDDLANGFAEINRKICKNLTEKDKVIEGLVAGYVNIMYHNNWGSDDMGASLILKIAGEYLKSLGIDWEVEVDKLEKNLKDAGVEG